MTQCRNPNTFWHRVRYGRFALCARELAEVRLYTDAGVHYAHYTVQPPREHSSAGRALH